MEWDETRFTRWLSSIGFAQYEAQIKGVIRLISDN